MWRVLVRSRAGNLVLAAIGGIYALSSFAVLVWLVADVWYAAATIDYLLQILLIASAACGVWFVAMALANLGVKLRQKSAGASNPASIHR